MIEPSETATPGQETPMAVKVILAAVSTPETARPALQAAFAVGRRFRAHVYALHVRPDLRSTVPYIGEGMSGAMLDDMMQTVEREASERAARVRAVFDELCAWANVVTAEPGTAEHELSASWREEAGREDEVIGRRGRLADLIVIARPRDASARMTLESALIESGRPILVAPPEPREPVGERIAIAWNGSVEASRAVNAAMPFLHRAERVVVLSVQESRRAESTAEDLAAYLAWHGIRASAHTIGSERPPTGATLLAEVSSQGGDMVVMGAYTHNRFREMIFGGVTRHVLSAAEVPVLMAH